MQFVDDGELSLILTVVDEYDTSSVDSYCLAAAKSDWRDFLNQYSLLYYCSLCY